MKSSCRRALLITAAICGAGVTTAWGQSVQGSTYEDNGSVVKIEFLPGGKAFTWMGPVSTPCTYAQNGKTVALTCEGDKTDFTVNDDGSLTGPPNGFISRLTKKKM
jgi:hypothetical protein